MKRDYLKHLGFTIETITMKKRLFQIFDEMNVNDEKNKTQTLPCAFTMVEAKSDKRGGLVTMGIEAHILQKIFFGEMQPILVVMDKKEYERIEKAVPITATGTQLPAEVGLQITKAAVEYANSLPFFSNEIREAYEAGATTYATKLKEAKQEIKEAYAQATLISNKGAEWEEKSYTAWEEIESLKRWKEEASALLNPILDYGQSKEANIPLGESITNTFLERCKQYDAACTLLEKVIYRHEGGLLPDRLLYNEIKTFLDGKI